MAFPDGWPPRPSPGALNIAFFVEGTATANYSDNAYLFIDGQGANPFQPTPYLAPGDEKEPTPLSSYGPGTPFGTGRDHRDAIPFNPNVFFRGNGLGTSRTTLVLSGTTVTYTDFTKKFTRDMVNKEIRLSGATSAANDGDFKITSVPTENSITWENSSGVTEDFPIAGSFRIRLVEESPPKAAIWSSTIRVANLDNTNTLYVSFNGTDDHGIVLPGDVKVYRARSEAGIALRAGAANVDFYVEAW